MSTEWARFSLADLATFKYGKFLAKSALASQGYPVFSGYGVVGFLPDYQFAEPQLLIVCRGEGGTGDVKMSPAKCSITNLAIVITPREERVSRKFLYWALKACDTHKLRTGSAQAQIVIGSLESFSVTIPQDSLLQAEIAHTLDSLNDRITLLRETNVTLEAIAQALFKSWFVDFEPVRAKMEGRPPEGMDEATAGLFPDGFEPSELGEVPRGWRVVGIYDVAKVTYGAPFASKLFKMEPPGKPLVRIRDLRDERPGVYTEEVHPKAYLLRPGDITVGMDGEFRAYIWGGELAWLNQRVCVFHPINGACSAFVRFSISPLLAAVEATETATTVIHLGKNDIDRFNVVVSSPEVLSAFAAVANPLYERLVANKQQAQTLSTLRDTLLPRLISGQLQLPEPQPRIEEANA